ncbi:MAG: DNA repair protein RecN [Rickettsiaceae bacterium]|nr:DNA repair protein RecN [Rickettsiaceae bacterium]
MLLSLSAKNFILIDKLDLDFSTGLHVITGETGAGKSILLDAILFCLGYKFDVGVIKKGTESCVVTLEAKVPESLVTILQENDIEHDGSILIKRQQFENGRKKISINDQIVTQKFLESIANQIVEIHGQNSHSALLDPSTHLQIVDSYGNLEQDRKEISQIFKEWKNLERCLEELSKEKHLIEREIDYLEFVVNEISILAVKEGEEEELATKRLELQKYEKSRNLLMDIHNSLTSPAIDSQIINTQKIINRQDKDGLFEELSKMLDEALVHIDEATNFLESKLRETEEGDIESVEERLFAIRDMARKHNIQASQVGKFLKESEEKLSILKEKVISEGNLIGEIEKLKKQYEKAALDLSKKRKSASENLENKIKSELSYLQMGNAVFKVDFKSLELENATTNGIDGIKFIASTNLGSDMASVEKIASGGELTRFMLAIKVALFDKFSKPTIIFDEVDTGIGGMVADSVGERLKFLSLASQVIAITHQPQVAGKADNHIFVHKYIKDGATSSMAKILSEEEKLEEIARMISGQKITHIAKEAARELIKKN